MSIKNRKPVNRLMSTEEFERDLERMLRNDEEMQRIYTFWRRYCLAMVVLVCCSAIFVIAVE